MAVLVTLGTSLSGVGSAVDVVETVAVVIVAAVGW
jgi:hypothetical protein